MIVDSPVISALLVEGRSSLVSMKAGGNKYRALALDEGAVLVRNSLMLPEVNGYTSINLFCDVRNKYDDTLKPVNIVGSFSGALALQGETNYYHFMMFHLPKFAFIPAVKGDALIVITSMGFPRLAEGLVTDMLTTLSDGRAVTHMQVPDGDYRLERSVVPMRPDSTAAPTICRNYVFPRAVRKAGLTDPIAQLGPLKLFVRRDGSGRRNLSNQAEVEELLARRGYVSISPGNMSMEEQAIAFSRATHIAGVEGAALTNLLFAYNAKAVTVLASPATTGEKFFQAIAKHYPYSFSTIYGEITTSRPTDRVADFSIPISAIEAL